MEEVALLVAAQREENEVATTEVANEVLRARRNLPHDLHRAREFLEYIGATRTFSEEALSNHDSQTNWILVTDHEQRIQGFAKWKVYGGARRTADVYLAVTNANPSTEAVLDHLLEVIPRELSTAGPTLVRLNIPSGQVSARQAALAHGFHPPAGAQDDHQTLQRLALGKLVIPENWQTIRQSLMSAASLMLPSRMPTFAEASRQVTLKAGTQEMALPVTELESELSPVLFLFSGRSGVIVPIRVHFAQDLIGAHPQFSMLTPPEAILRSERVYVSSPKAAGKMRPGTPMLFYESQKYGGRGCLFAVARITESRIVAKTDALEKVLHRGVLDRQSLEKRSVGRTVAETSFDNIFIFKKPVSLKRLRELGCADGSNLVSATTIPFEKLVEVVKEGQVNG